jgi:hypothetical protein
MAVSVAAPRLKARMILINRPKDVDICPPKTEDSAIRLAGWRPFKEFVPIAAFAKPLKFKELEHVKIEKAEQLFLDMLHRQ